MVALEARDQDSVAGAEPQRQCPARTGARASASPRDRGELETLLGLTWFNRLGALVLVIGLALAALWANDRGYLTAEWRNALAAVVAILVFAAGARAATSRESGRRGFGIGVTIVGGFGLYLVPVTASRIDVVISPLVATAIMMATTIALAGLALRARSFVFALLGLCGGLLTPAIGSGDSSYGLLFVYLAPLAIGFAGVQHRRSWRGLDIIASTGVCAYYLAWLADESGGGGLALAVGLALWAIHLLYEGFRQRVADSANGFHFSLLAVAIISGAGALYSTALPALAIAALIVLLAAHVYLWRHPHRPRALFALAWAAGLGLTGAILGDAPGLTAPELQALMAVGIALPFLVLYVTRSLSTELGDEDHALVITATGIYVLAWIVIAVAAVDLAIAAPPLGILGVGWLATAEWLTREERGGPAIGWAFNLSALLCATAVVLALTATDMPLPSLSVWATVVFTLCALALVAIGVHARQPVSRLLGIGLLAAAVVKLLALDVWSLNAGTRIGVLIAIGLGLLAASFLYSRFTDRPGSTPPVDLDQIVVDARNQVRLPVVEPISLENSHAANGF